MDPREMADEIDRLRGQVAELVAARQIHVQATAPYDATAGSGGGVESHSSGDENKVWVRPFFLRDPMMLRRFTTWFSSTVGNTCKMYCGLYRYSNFKSGLRNLRAPESYVGALTEDPPLFDLVRPLMFQVFDANADTIREVSQDLESDLYLAPGAYGIGYQVENSTGTWYWTTAETSPVSTGFRAIHEEVPMGRLPRQLRVRLGAGLSVPGPFALLRSHLGVRVSPTGKEITG